VVERDDTVNLKEPVDGPSGFALRASNEDDLLVLRPD
jgi:hypothetical protein